MRSKEEAAGLYAHVPFCIVRCGYCDFYSQVGEEDRAPAFLDALARDIAGWPDRNGHAPAVATIFLGGGTPSFVPAEGIRRVLDACRGAFPVEPGAEITIEANPESVTTEALETWRRAGVNRLSIGIQSLRDDRLTLLDRPHDAARAREAIRLARATGFDDLSGDFIYGTPGQSADAWRGEIEEIAALGLDHVSAYILETDKDTPLARRLEAGELAEPEAGEIAAQWEITSRALSAAGYHRYEIANHAIPGRECRHNLGYWTGRPYLGFGPSAHGFVGGRRTLVRLGAAAYVRAVERGEETQETVEEPDRDRCIVEAIITGLRLSDGCDFDALSERYGVDVADRFGPVLDGLSREGWIERNAGRVRLVDERIPFSNEALCRFV